MGRAPTRKRRASKGSRRGGSPVKAKKASATRAGKTATRTAAKPVRRRAASAVDARAEIARLTHKLREARQREAATADVLKVISRSAFDLTTVLQTLVESAARLCEADKTVITRQVGGLFYRAEACGFSTEYLNHVKNMPVVPERGSAGGRVLIEGRAIQILDVRADKEFTCWEAQRLGDFRAVLAVPILRGDTTIGVAIAHPIGSARIHQQANRTGLQSRQAGCHSD